MDFTAYTEAGSPTRAIARRVALTAPTGHGRRCVACGRVSGRRPPTKGPPRWRRACWPRAGAWRCSGPLQARAHGLLARSLSCRPYASRLWPTTIPGARIRARARASRAQLCGRGRSGGDGLRRAARAGRRRRRRRRRRGPSVRPHPTGPARPGPGRPLTGGSGPAGPGGLSGGRLLELNRALCGWARIRGGGGC